MTATPIPRTLALTFYGDLDVTTIEGSPAGRTPVVTRLVGEEKRPQGYEFMRKQLDKGRQAYVVCPNIEESEALQTAAALEEAERLRRGEFRDYRVEVIHGQLKTAERERVMAAFKAGEIDVLVATTVIEVGIDVPNATVMMIESAERFGLAQLHQLRGRVGRGTQKSYCLLFAETTTRNADARLKAMLETNDGFVLADKDLEIRGEGQLFGTRQSGLPDLKIAKLTRDRETVIRARRLARALLDADPELEQPRERPPERRPARGLRRRGRLAAEGLRAAAALGRAKVWSSSGADASVRSTVRHAARHHEDDRPQLDARALEVRLHRAGRRSSVSGTDGLQDHRVSLERGRHVDGVRQPVEGEEDVASRGPYGPVEPFVARGLGDRLVERGVGAAKGDLVVARGVGIPLLEHVDALPHRRQVAPVPPAGGEEGAPGLEGDAVVEELVELGRVLAYAFVPQLLRQGQVGDEVAAGAPADRLDEALLSQGLQGLADGGARDGQLLRQLALGRQALPLGQLPAADAASQLLGYLPAGAAWGGDMSCQALMAPPLNRRLSTGSRRSRRHPAAGTPPVALGR